LLLQREGGRHVKVSLFERDATPWTRDQGTSLDLGGGAARVLRRAGVSSAVKQASRPGSDVTLVFGADGTELYSLEMPHFLSRIAPTGEEVNRNELRDLLLAPLQDGTVHWNHEVESFHVIESNGMNQVQLHFRSSGKVLEPQTFDVVVGADGSTSSFRSHLFDDSGHEPFTGFACAQGFVLDPARACPLANEMLGNGSMMVLAGGLVMWAQRYASNPQDARICFYVSVPASSPSSLAEAVAAFGDEKDAVHRWAQERLSVAGCCEALQQLVAAADWYVLRNFYQWPANPRPAANLKCLPVVLCGDALHAMLPFQGAGANVGVQDAGDVASAIVRASRNPDPVLRQRALIAGLRAAEKSMLSRSSEEAQSSLDATVFFHSADAASQVDSRFFGGPAAEILCAMRKVELRCGSDWFWPATFAAVAATLPLAVRVIRAARGRR